MKETNGPVEPQFGDLHLYLTLCRLLDWILAVDVARRQPERYLVPTEDQMRRLRVTFGPKGDTERRVAALLIRPDAFSFAAKKSWSGIERLVLF